ncbi:thermonuclease family protein [Phormidesmis priestleyi]
MNLGQACQKFFLLLAPLGLCLLLGCQRAVVPQGAIVPVEWITPQQELEVAGIAGQPDITERVKLAGIVIPSLNQKPWGEVANTRLEQLIHQSVLLEPEETVRDDRGQRSVYVWSNGSLINEKLVAEGYALATSPPSKSPYQRRLSRAQDRARILGLGIWNPQTPMRHEP